MSIQYEVEQLPDSYGVADSFPKDFGYGEEEAEIEDSPTSSDSKPRILLMGLRRSGKSSIQKVSIYLFVLIVSAASFGETRASSCPDKLAKISKLVCCLCCA